MPLRVPMCSFSFAGITFSGTSSSFLSLLHSTFMSSSNFGCTYSLSNGGVSPFPQSATFLFFYNSIYAWFKSTYSIISLPHFYLCWAILSQLSTFVKCHMDLSLGDKNTRQLHALLSVPERNHRCTVTNYQQPLKEVTWSVTDQDVYLLFMWWFINWRASSKVCTVYNYSQIIYCGNWIWTMLLRDNTI